MFGLTLLLASCGTDMYQDWADPMSNDPEPGKAVTLAVGQAPAIDYATLTSDQVQLFSPSVTVAVTEGGVGMYLAESTYDVVLWNADKTASETLTTTNGYVAADDLKAVVEKLYGKRPTARDIAMDITAYTDINGTSVANKATSTVTVTLKAPKISPNYYVVGGSLDWQQSAINKLQKFNHSGADVYDDPVFTIRIKASFDDDGNRTDTWFAIGDDEACESIGNGDWSKLLGTTGGNGNTSYTGYLAPRTELSDDGSICMKADDQAVAYKITLNMMEYSYTIEPIPAGPEIWWLVGADIGDGSWHNSVADIGTGILPMAFMGNDKVTYTGYFAGNGFKLIKTPGSWDDQWGQGSAFGSFIKNEGGSGNITVPGPGYYTVTLDYANDVLTVVAVDLIPTTYAIGMAGSFNGWSFAAMTACPGDGHMWMTDLTATNDVEGKFLIDGWSVNWGATDFPSGIGTQNGPNIPIEAGDYVVLFNDITGDYMLIEQ